MRTLLQICESISAYETAAYERGVADGRKMRDEELKAERQAVGERLIPLSVVLAKTGWSEDFLAQVRRLEKDFPKPKTFLQSRNLYWLETDIDRFIKR